MADAYICDYIRTPIGRFGGVLSPVRADDLGAIPIRALTERNAGVDWEAVDEVYYGCANQAGEDNRNVARMSSLLAGLPVSVPGATINRLCGSGMDAVIMAARAVKAGEIEIAIAGGVESMSRAPFVMPKAQTAFSRHAEVHDTTIGWRFINPVLKKQYGVDSMPETGENVAEEYKVSREDQDAFALRSQAKAAAAQKNGRLAREIVPVTIPQRKGDPVIVEKDEHPRETSMEALAKLRTPFRENGSVTAGNASGVNDGAAAPDHRLGSGDAKKYGLTPIARIVGGATAGVPPRIMGIGPAPATKKLCARTGLDAAGFRRHRTERGLRQPGYRRTARSGHRRGRGTCERRMAARSRSVIRSACRVPASPARRRWRCSSARRQAGAGDHVHRRRPGHRHCAGSRLRRPAYSTAGKEKRTGRKTGAFVFHIEKAVPVRRRRRPRFLPPS